uniref:Uncharacterized protein n=2 Tax=Anguilla anguilla TaxID=7936 RepID=A0A0E9TN04_ANGAN
MCCPACGISPCLIILSMRANSVCKVYEEKWPLPGSNAIRVLLNRP